MRKRRRYLAYWSGLLAGVLAGVLGEGGFAMLIFAITLDKFIERGDDAP